MHIRALFAALVGVCAAIVPVTAAQAAAGCEVTYSASTWSTGFAANFQIKNLGDTWNGYVVGFTFTANQQITQSWNHTVTQSGPHVTMSSAATVATGQSIWLGFLGNHTGVNTPPTNWRVNGVACTLAGQPPAVIAEPDEVTVPEGTSGSFTVRLSHPPAANTFLMMSISGTGVWASPPIALYFTPTNWSTPQRFSVVSMPDADTIDDRVVFTLSATGYTPDTVTFTQLDDD
ncbi:cellulose binding domain-containing protein [Phytohabitans rumicis]|uniref:CBM2 domain-containing protein n=1 Tax=Phytohabitans rumicis TaxID=1076125 RepID=A0A6V8L9H4_9ACTN|nr:cellulose binding domain-containing protein [Phytohabitans rumicis]GFJ91658.1 hypothetical protein Prum_053000 [Phytohabitans rumicis]